MFGGELVLCFPLYMHQVTCFFSFGCVLTIFSHIFWRYKESTCNSGDLGSIPGLGRPPGERHGYALQYSCLENPKDRGYSPWGPWGGHSPRGRKEVDPAEQHTLPLLRLDFETGRQRSF